MLSWQFEASIDKENWIALDMRIYTGIPNALDPNIQEEIRQLCQKGATSTWGIDREKVFLYSKGFRFFRIIQIDKNSSGSDNMALSGIELYGRIVSGRIP